MIVADGLVKIMLLAPADPSVKDPDCKVVPVRTVAPVTVRPLAKVEINEA